jgi:hypothetical protein
LTGFNETMDAAINSAFLEHALPEAFKEVGPQAPLDIIFNSYLNKEDDRNYVSHGENSFSIVDNAIQALGTFSFELLAHVPDARFGTVWKLLRSGYFKAKVNGLTIKTVEPFIVNVGVKSVEFEALKLYNFEEKLTGEEDHFIKALTKSIEAHQQKGYNVNLEPVLQFATCLGLKPESFEISIESDHIVIGMDRFEDGFE